MLPYSLDFSAVRVLIVGDVMLDRYVFGSADRISPEAPVPVVKVLRTEDRPGGAGNVALNVVALGAQAHLIAVVGEDEGAQSLRRALTSVGVTLDFVSDPSFTTTVKERVLSQHQQLLRLDRDAVIAKEVKGDILHAYQAALKHTDLVILSDYAKGVLQGGVSQELIVLAKAQGIPVLVDPKHHDFAVYEQATLVTPNAKEFQAVVGPCRTESEMVKAAHALMKRHGLAALLLTRGEQGMVLFEAGQPEYYLPARGREVFDVTGAGDTVISVLALALGAGHDMLSAVELSNIAAGVVIGKLGAATLSIQELIAAQEAHLPEIAGVVSEEVLLTLVKAARAKGETIVFTNGCFDVLHAMHVEYLGLAKQQGQRLIVAVNDDASITRLKGEGRPVNKLEHRMAVLAGLQSVDWVLSFSDDTPCRLLEAIKPDVLAKGGDYALDGVVGAEVVGAYGGKVVTLGGMADGVKSTAIIERMKPFCYTLPSQQ